MKSFFADCVTVKPDEFDQCLWSGMRSQNQICHIYTAIQNLKIHFTEDIKKTCVPSTKNMV